jgi:hypothetical protein
MEGSWHQALILDISEMNTAFFLPHCTAGWVRLLLVKMKPKQGEGYAVCWVFKPQ